MIYCVPRLEGRGVGLANELIPWAKAYLAAEALQGVCLTPAWGLNKRGYFRNFETPRMDAPIRILMQKAYPVSLTFDSDCYRKHFDPDFACSVEKWFRSKDVPRWLPKIVFVEGLWGGYHALARARRYLLSQLLVTRRTLANLFAKSHPSGSPRRLRIGVHYRSGDFKDEFRPGDGKGRWNRRMRLGWYSEVCRKFRDEFGPEVEFLLVTDASISEVGPFLQEFEPTTTFDQNFTEISDLLLLSSCDVIVPSLSSYSLAAIAFGDAAYVWPEEHLVELNGCWTLWGDQSEYVREITAQNAAKVVNGGVSSLDSRAFAFNGTLSQRFVELIRLRSNCMNPVTDLATYGVLKIRDDEENLSSRSVRSATLG